MADTYECATCGVISEGTEHLCKPRILEGKHDYCGSGAEKVSQMCETMSGSLEYECASCGRPAENPDLVCQPTRIG
ncbi:MAG TPA: hypothetical protein VGA63_08820 [Geopsychrobacteraceae bacterium]|jgi:DNA-directed RNA polymerase subunit RPC12/RpoP